MEREDVVRLIGDISEDYDFEVSTRTIDTWYRHLQDKETQRVRKTYERFFETDTRGKAPTISQLCSAYKSVNGPKEVFYAERPELHWNKFGELEDDKGYIYCDPDWTDEDYKRQRELYKMRTNATESEMEQARFDIDNLIKQTAERLGG